MHLVYVIFHHHTQKIMEPSVFCLCIPTFVYALFSVQYDRKRDSWATGIAQRRWETLWRGKCCWGSLGGRRSWVPCQYPNSGQPYGLETPPPFRMPYLWCRNLLTVASLATVAATNQVGVHRFAFATSPIPSHPKSGLPFSPLVQFKQSSPVGPGSKDLLQAFFLGAEIIMPCDVGLPTCQG